MPSPADQLGPFDLAFRELYLRDILQADRGDVRMGTFILCGAFIDALALTYSAGTRVPRQQAGKWAIFMERYFGEPYQDLWDSYDAFRNKLLHNYSPRGIAFTHGPEKGYLHLQVRSGRVYLHRESFVADVERAYHAFAADLHDDVDLRQRALLHLEEFPPMGLIPVLAPGNDIYPSDDLYPARAPRARRPLRAKRAGAESRIT